MWLIWKSSHVLNENDRFGGTVSEELAQFGVVHPAYGEMVRLFKKAIWT